MRIKVSMNLFTQLESNAKKIRLGLIGSSSIHALKACEKAHKNGIAELVFFGNAKRTQESIEKIGFSAPYTMHEAENYADAASQAVALAKKNEIDTLLKGSADTSTVLRALFNKEKGIPPKKLCSSVSIFQYNKRFVLLTDPAINIYPSLEQKIEIIKNALEVAHCLGIEAPKVAVLSPTEVVQEKIKETIHGAELSKMAKEGFFGSAFVESMALDVALSAHSAQAKDIYNEVAGQADILIAHDLNAANILHKSFSLFTTEENGALVIGSSIPVIITSRGEDEKTKYNSILLAGLYTSHRSNF